MAYSDQNQNPFVTLTPYDDQLEKLRQRQRMADLLQQQAMQPLESQTAPGGYVVPTSPLLGLAKMLQAYSAGRVQRGINTELSDIRNKAAYDQRQKEAEIESAGKAIQGRMFGQRDEYTKEGQPVVSGPTVSTPAAPPSNSDQLEEITPTGQYKYDPQGAFQMAMTPAGSAALQKNTLMASMLANMVKPKEPEEFYAPTEVNGEMIQFGHHGGIRPTGYTPPSKTSALPSAVQEYQYAVGQGFKGTFDQWDQQRKKAGASTTVVNTGNTYGSTVAKSLGESDSAFVNAARSAPTQIESANRIKSLLAQNPITGTGADARLALDKALSTAGLIDKNRTRATETLVSALAGSTLDSVKTSGLGTGQGFTDKDRDFLEKAKSGNIEINAGTLRDLADLQEKIARLSITKGNAVLRRWKKSGSFGPEFDLEEVAMPGVSGGLPPGATRDRP